MTRRFWSKVLLIHLIVILLYFSSYYALIVRNYQSPPGNFRPTEKDGAFLMSMPGNRFFSLNQGAHR